MRCSKRHHVRQNNLLGNSCKAKDFKAESEECKIT